MVDSKYGSDAVEKHAAETTRTLSASGKNVDQARIEELSRDHIASVLDLDPRENSLAG